MKSDELIHMENLINRLKEGEEWIGIANDKEYYTTAGLFFNKIKARQGNDKNKSYANRKYYYSFMHSNDVEVQKQTLENFFKANIDDIMLESQSLRHVAGEALVYTPEKPFNKTEYSPYFMLAYIQLLELYGLS